MNTVETYQNQNRGILIEVHIADIHFSAFDPSLQYEILLEQFLTPISELPKIDIISIDGDLFDHKLMANSEAVTWAVTFVDNLVQIAKRKDATLVILQGTYSHDANQLNLFYHYASLADIDVRIVTTMRFEYIKGAKILMIPELYGIDEHEYRRLLFGRYPYDSAFMHGTIKGAVYGDTVGNGRLFTIEDFINCRGPIIAGHVHKSGCFNGYFYYCGCPYRWKFGEEEDKGYLLVAHDLDTGYHYVQFEKIESFRYDTIYVDELFSSDPKAIIEWIKNVKESKHIDFIKVKFRTPVQSSSKTIINNYYRNVKDTFVEFMDIEEEQKSKIEEEIKNSEFDFITDDKLSDLEKFVMYVNHSEKSQFITVEDLKKILEEEI